MQKRTLKVALLAALALIMVLAFAGTALAWSDLNAGVWGKYGITEDQIGEISEGYPDGTWRPFQDMPRKQFTKMAVEAYNVPLKNPDTPTFSDVPKSDYYYQYIEGAYAAGLVNGVGGGLFAPNQIITREQAVAIIVRYVAPLNGYDIATYYTDDEVAALLGEFGDADAVGPSLRREMAFAIDFGITVGNAYGNLAPKMNLTRIQGAAMLIRSWFIIPPEPPAQVPAEIVLVGADEAENLIGITHQYTFQVNDDEGMPIENVLVDIDTLTAQWHVGNIAPSGGLTDEYGQITINLMSAEPGWQRVYASAMGEAGQVVVSDYATKYWVVLDEVYIVGEREAENNAGDVHTWWAQTYVFGPGPLSTSVSDWYNFLDGVEGYDYDTDYVCWDEVAALMLEGWTPRTMAGIPMYWEIYDGDELFDSVGDIVDAGWNASIAADGQSAWTFTDEDGMTWIDILSYETGYTDVSVIADYAGNPYPGMLFDHSTFNYAGWWDHNYEWQDQPSGCAWAYKLWIPHVIGGDEEGPITPSYAVNNTGEVEVFTLTLQDVYGNPIPDYTVEWWIQGVGFFKTDGTTWVGPGEYNKDVDVTDENGQAEVYVKSLEPGQTIVHCKVMDKPGLPWKEWNVVKQWYSIDDVSFEEGYASNLVNTGHEFLVRVSGAKYVYTIYDVNENGLRDDKVLIGYREDLEDTWGWFVDWEGNFTDQGYGYLNPGQVFFVGDPGNREEGNFYTRFADITLEDAEFWYDGDGDGINEVWRGLEGKGVNFFTNIVKHDRGGLYLVDEAQAPGLHPDLYECYVNSEFSNLSASADAKGNFYVNVGSITGAGEPWEPVWYGGATYDYDAKTDEMGYAWVDINSVNKGWQFVVAVADYPANPQDGDAAKPSKFAELRWDLALKEWYPDAYDSYKVYGYDGETAVEGNRWENPVDGDWTRDGESSYWPSGDVGNPNTHGLAVQVFDQYGNALEDYKVTWEIVGQGTVTQGQIPTYHPYAHFAAAAWDYWDEKNPLVNGDWGYAGVGDLNKNLNENPWWGEWNDGVHPLQTPDALDDNWAWGWTKNGVINYEFSDLSAAWAVLVLDEEYDELAQRPEEHFTTIVNVKIYSPSGALIDHFEVTKVWTLETPELDAIVIEQSLVEEGAWTQDPLTVYGEAVDVRGVALDQWGRPLFGGPVLPTGYKIQAVATVGGYNFREVWDLAGYLVDGDGWVYDTFSGMPPVTVYFTAWFDANANDIIDAGEIVSNTLETTFVYSGV
jgi:hypothetical protein